MCKLLFLTQHNSRDLSSLVVSAWAEMAKTDEDGFGAAWFAPDGAIRHVKSSAPSLDRLPDWCGGFRAGKISASDGGALLIHGRTATCGVNEENTHPMLAPDFALCHNGVVTSRTYRNESTTCDSELLLSAWRKGGVAEVAQEISGYYAFGVLSREGRHRHLDIVRDSRAVLRYGRAGRAHVFGTTDALVRVAGAEPLADLSANTHVSFRDGKHVRTVGFTPRPPEITSTLARSAARAFSPDRGKDRGQYFLDADWPASVESTNWRTEEMR